MCSRDGRSEHAATGGRAAASDRCTSCGSSGSQICAISVCLRAHVRTSHEEARARSRAPWPRCRSRPRCSASAATLTQANQSSWQAKERWLARRTQAERSAAGTAVHSTASTARAMPLVHARGPPRPSRAMLLVHIPAQSTSSPLALRSRARETTWAAAPVRSAQRASGHGR